MSPAMMLDGADVSTLSPLDAVRAIETALRAGLDPADTPARGSFGAAAGELLLMPAAARAGVGVKLVTIAPDNPERGLPRIHGVYVLFDPETLAPVAILEAAALTTLRTPAVSLAAVRDRLPDRRPVRVVVFGAGPQGIGHLRTLAAVLADETSRHQGPIKGEDPSITAAVVVRDVARAHLGVHQGVRTTLLAAGTPAVHDALARADVVVCATTSTSPLFPADLVRDHALVIAVGAHEPSASEVPPELTARAAVVVEDPATALREAGVVRAGITQGSLHPDRLVAMKDVVTHAVTLPTDRPVLFVSVGMAWEDLAVALAVHRAHSSRT